MGDGNQANASHSFLNQGKYLVVGNIIGRHGKLWNIRNPKIIQKNQEDSGCLKRKNYWVLRLLLILLTSSLSSSVAFGAVGISPGRLLIQNVKPGAELDLARAGQPIIVFGENVQAKVLNLFEVGSWEYGYEYMPEGWVRIQEEENEQDVRGQKKSSLIFSVPEGANIFNRRFVIGLSASQAVDEKKGTTGIMLKVNARYLLETMSLEGADGKPGGTLAFMPGTSLLKGVGQGAKAEARFKFWNNSNDKRKFYMRRLWDLYPAVTENSEQENKSREEKFKCYFSGSVEPILWRSWIEGNEEFELKAGGARDVKWRIVVPETAIPGKTYEEIVFLGDETLWTKTDFNNSIGVCRRMAKAAKDQKDKPVLRILQSLVEKDREALLKKAAGEIKDEKEKDAMEQCLIECFNKLLAHRNLVEKGLLGENIEKQGELGVLMAIDPKDLKDEELRRLNRLWIEKAFGSDVHSFRSFGASGKVAFARIRVVVADK